MYVMMFDLCMYVCMMYVCMMYVCMMNVCMYDVGMMYAFSNNHTPMSVAYAQVHPQHHHFSISHSYNAPHLHYTQ